MTGEAGEVFNCNVYWTVERVQSSELLLRVPCTVLCFGRNAFDGFGARVLNPTFNYQLIMENASFPLETVETVVFFVAQSLSAIERTFYKLPGSAIIERYVRSSHQNDPGRTFLELIILFLVIINLLQSRTRPDRNNGKSFLELTDQVWQLFSLYRECVY